MTVAGPRHLRQLAGLPPPRRLHAGRPELRRPNPCTGGMTPSPLPLSPGRPRRCRPVLLPSCSRPRRVYAPRARASLRPLAPRPAAISSFTPTLLVPASARRGCRPRPPPLRAGLRRISTSAPGLVSGHRPAAQSYPDHAPALRRGLARHCPPAARRTSSPATTPRRLHWPGWAPKRAAPLPQPR